jgi:hypothetical protein
LEKSLKDFLNNLDSEEKQLAKECIDNITTMTIEYAIETDEKERERIKNSIEHYKNALINLEAIASLEAYGIVISTIGNVIKVILTVAVATLL